MNTLIDSKMNATSQFNLVDLTSMVTASAKLNEDRMYKAADCHFNYGILETPDGPLPATEEGQYQIADRCGVPRRVYEFLKIHDRDIWQKVVNDRWTAYAEDDKTFLARLRKQEDGNIAVRGLLSDRYGKFDNTEFLQILAANLPVDMQNANFTGWKNNAAIDPISGHLQAKLIIPTTFPGSERDPHGLGLSISNNEVGGGCAQFSGVFSRFRCTNQFRMDQHDLRLTHQGKRVDHAEEALSAAIQSIVRKSAAQFQTYWNSRDLRLDDPADAIRNLVPFVKIGKKLRERMVEEKLPSNLTETGYTGFSVIQTATEFARDLENIEHAHLIEEAVGVLASSPRKFFSPFLVGNN